MGLLYIKKGRYIDAIPLYERRLLIAEETFGSDSALLTDTLSQLAWLNYAIRKTKIAEEQFQRALTITEKSQDATSVETADGLFQLGLFYERSAQYQKSFKAYERALQIKEQKLGINHTEVRDLFKKCACALRLNDREDEAEEIERRAGISTDGSLTDNVSRVSGKVLQGKAVRRAQPEYPAAAVRERVSGSVIIEVLVDESGNVIDVKVKCGPGLLTGAALTAARKWKFTTTTLNGVPMRVIGTIKFNFKL
jgi:TonB family protein